MDMTTIHEVQHVVEEMNFDNQSLVGGDKNG